MNIGNLFDDFYSLTIPVARPSGSYRHTMPEQDPFAPMLAVQEVPAAEAEIKPVATAPVSTLDWLRIIDLVAETVSESQPGPNVVTNETLQSVDPANNLSFCDFSRVVEPVAMVPAAGMLVFHHNAAVNDGPRALTMLARPVIPSTRQSPDTSHSAVLNLHEGQVLLWSTIATGHTSFQWLAAIHQPFGQDRSHSNSLQSLQVNTKTAQVQHRIQADIVTKSADTDSAGWLEQSQELVEDRLDLSDIVSETSSSLVFLQSEFQKEYFAFSRAANSIPTIFYRNYFSPMPEHELIQQWMNLSGTDQGVIYLNGRQYRNGAN